MFKKSMLCLLLLSLHLPLLAQSPCPNNLPPRLTIGEQGRVLPGDANRLRQDPTLDAEQIIMIPGAGVFDVIAGPACADGYTWWQVDYAGQVGWTAEGAPDEYWLEPMEIAPLSVATTVRNMVLVEHRNSLGEITFAVSDMLAEDITHQPLPIVDMMFYIPARSSYTLVGYPDDPDDFYYPPFIELYAVRDWETGEDFVVERLEALRKLLDTQPETVIGEIPVLPFVNAAQIMQARPQFIEMQNGVGLRFLTYYAQDLAVPDNNLIVYEFIGLLDEGRYYVHAMLPLDVDFLPDETDYASLDYEELAQNFQTVLAEETKQLLNASPEAFTPRLEDIDAIFESMLFAP